jgi:hypothetical protein
MTSPSRSSPEAWALLFTNLYDDELPQLGCDQSTKEIATYGSTPCSTSQTQSLLRTSGKRQANEDQNHLATNSNKRKKGKLGKVLKQSIPELIIFSSTTGEAAQPPKRSVFSKERRAESRQVRELGACLRCKLRKTPVCDRLVALHIRGTSLQQTEESLTRASVPWDISAKNAKRLARILGV